MWSFRARRLCVGVLSLLPVVAVAEAEAPLQGPPIQLGQAIAQALEKNPDLAAFGYEFQAQDGRSVQAALVPNPLLNLSVEDALGSGARSGIDSAEFTISLSQVLERGARQSRIALAAAGRDKLAATQLEKLVDTAAETARRYGHVLSDQAQLTVTHDAIELAQQTVDMARKRVKAGAVPSAEVARALAALARAELEHEHAEHELLTSRRQLASLWGDREPAFGTALGDLMVLPELAPFEALAARLQANPALLAFVAEQRVRDAELKLAEQRRKPAWQVSAGLRRYQSGNDFAGVFGLSIPLGVRDPAQGTVAEARALSEQVSVQRTAAETRGLTQLFELFQELKHARTAADTLDRAVLPQISEALRQTEYAYSRGRYGYQELIAAQQELLDARRARIQAAADGWGYATEIDRLTGLLPARTTP